MLIAVFFGYGLNIMLAYIAAVVHELSHLIACILLNVKAKQLYIGAVGLRLETEFIINLRKRIVIALAGPLVSFLLFIFFSYLSVIVWPSPFCYRFAFMNLCIAGINMIPVMPLDGAVILKNTIALKNGIIYAGICMNRITSILLTIMIISDIMLAVFGIICISVYVITVFLLISVRREKEAFMLEKKYILCNQISGSKCLRYINVSADTTLMSIASRITPGFETVAAVFSNGRFKGEINHASLIIYIQKYGASAKAGDIIEKENPGPW